MSNIPIDERHKWIGSSESAAMLGVSPYLSRFELWHRKNGSIPTPDVDSDRMAAGRFLEPAIAVWAQAKWKWSLRKVENYDTHPTIGGMGASVDFQDSSDHPVEIKNVDKWFFRENWTAEGDEIIDAPLHYLIQVQHQLACRPPMSYGWLVACVGGNSLYRMKIKRHPGTIAKIETTIDRFWQTIKAGEEPRPDFKADAAAVIKLYAASNSVVVDLTANNRLPELCATYKTGAAAQEAGKAERLSAKAEILSIMGTAHKAVCGDGYIISAPMVRETELPPTKREAYRAFQVNRASKYREEIEV